LIVALVLNSYQNSVFQLLTNIAEVKETSLEVFFIALIGLLPDLWYGYLQGVIRALGLQ
jgi:Na+-driven multidrug efflux pump